MPDRRAAKLLCLALLCLVAYGRSLTLPLFQDDYPMIADAQRYGPASGFAALVRDGWPLPRATIYWLSYVLWMLFGPRPVAYHMTSLAIHIANTFLLWWICRSWAPMRSAALYAAAFFAVHEGHQEAVMWFSSAGELLMFTFGAAALFCWRNAVNARHSDVWAMGSFLLYCMALFSKESAFVFLPLFLLVTPVSEWRFTSRLLLPHFAAALAVAVFIVSTRGQSFRFSDGSFSLHAPFWITWTNSYVRLLWIWGWIAGVWLIFRTGPSLRRHAVPALVWVGIALIPYSFLTYMHRIPSRQVYLASAGLAMLVGLAMAHLLNLNRRIAMAVGAVIVLHNAGYLWTRKHEQFLERAAPTEALISLARKTEGPIWVRCFPGPRIVAEQAVRLATGRSPETLLWNDASHPPLGPVTTFCNERR